MNLDIFFLNFPSHECIYDSRELAGIIHGSSMGVENWTTILLQTECKNKNNEWMTKIIFIIIIIIILINIIIVDDA
jgi:hypothetical protein